MIMLEQYEKWFPAVSEEVFKERINIIKKTLKMYGYEIDRNKSNDERIYFRTKLIKTSNSSTIKRYSEMSFGLWQIRHETDEDFENGFNRLKIKLKEGATL